MNNIYLKYFTDKGFTFGRLISQSKSGYVRNFPENEPIFNARIYTEEYYEKEKNGDIKDFFAGAETEIWYGDLDLTLDSGALQQIADEIKVNIVITTEYGQFKKIFNTEEKINNEKIR